MFLLILLVNQISMKIRKSYILMIYLNSWTLLSAVKSPGTVYCDICYMYFCTAVKCNPLPFYIQTYSPTVDVYMLNPQWNIIYNVHVGLHLLV